MTELAERPLPISADNALVIENLSKTFGATKALRNVSLTVRAGEIHALVGMNGSGKSTLVKILSGFHTPDPGGRALIAGAELTFGDPEAARRLGAQFVHQDLGLLSSLTTVENLALEQGYAARAVGPINWKREIRRTEEALTRLGYALDVRKPVGQLSAAQRSAVAIARAFVRSQDMRAIILDEPTASMPASEADDLFALLRRVASRGVGVVFISHHFEEIFQLADRVSVLRDGVLVATEPIQSLTHDRLVEHVVGSKVISESRPRAVVEHRPLLRASGVAGGTLRSLDLVVHAGEVVGVAGLDGSGREVVCQLLFGALDRQGDVSVNGTALTVGRPDRAISAGLALVPAERHRDALFGTMSVRENVTMGALEKFLRWGWLSRRRETREVDGWIGKLLVRTPSAEQKAAALSGGNQQKLVFARALRRQPTVLLLDEPTQGVDVRAKEDIYASIRSAADGGSAVVLASSDTEELCRNCSRVVVLSLRGDVVELTGDDVDEHTVNRLMLRGSAREVDEQEDGESRGIGE
jgi:ribose transport system ATP-binding protein